MVLAAKGDGKVEPVTPQEDSPIGDERAFIKCLTGKPVTSVQLKKKKVWECVLKDLKTAEGAVAIWTARISKHHVANALLPHWRELLYAR